MITRDELLTMLTMPMDDFVKKFSGWGVVHTLKWIGEMQHAIDSYAKKDKEMVNKLREFYLIRIKFLEKKAYERFVKEQKPVFYKRDPTYVGRQRALKIDVRKAWSEVYRQYCWV